MNWGYKLLITFLVFGGMIGYLVYRSVNTNFELVEKDYYKSELRYQHVIDATLRTNQLSTAVRVDRVNDSIWLRFPPEMKGSVSSGSIFFYCASGEEKDKKMALQLDGDAEQLIPVSAIGHGSYSVKIDWTNRDKNYYTEKSIVLP